MLSHNDYVIKKKKWAKFMIRQLTASLRPHPSFMIIGAQKGGTTSLYCYLQQNPRIGSNLRKEVGYFSEHYENNERWYRAHFALSILPQQRLSFDATPEYLSHPLVPSRVKAKYPHMKFILLLRNPVERAYSGYQHVVKRGKEDRTFEEMITRLYRLEKLSPAQQNESVQWLPEKGYHNVLARGKYVDQLTRWFQYFPREQFLIMQSEYFYAQTTDAMKQISAFLEVPYWETTELKVRNAGGSYPEMDPHTRQQLVEYFKPYNTRLYQLLGKNYGWE